MRLAVSGSVSLLAQHRMNSTLFQLLEVMMKQQRKVRRKRIRKRKSIKMLRKKYDESRPSDYGDDRRSVNRRLWVTRGSEMMGSECDEFCNTRGEFFEKFAGFLLGSGETGGISSNTPSSQPSYSHINMEDVKIFTTPRKLIRSLQDVHDHCSAFSMKDVRKIRSPATSTFSWTPKSKCEQNCVHHNINSENIRDELLHGGSESVSSTEDPVK